MMLAQLIQNFRTAGRLVSDNLIAGAFLQFVDQLLRKSGFREGLKRFINVKPHHFPMARHCILADGSFQHLCVIPQRITLGLNAKDRMQIAIAEFFHSRHR